MENLTVKNSELLTAKETDLAERKGRSTRTDSMKVHMKVASKSMAPDSVDPKELMR
jgi:hypothetical protein